jgi:hypothetical protein
VDVEVRAPDYVAASRTVAIVAGQYQRVVLRLAKEKPEAAVPLIAVAPPRSPEQVQLRTRSVVRWSMVGLAAVGLATGTVATILHERNVSKVTDNHCFDRDGMAVDESGNPVASCQGPLDASKTDRTLQVVGFAAAAAFAATWLVLTLTEPAPRSDEKHARSAVTCAPSVSSLGWVCGGRF